MELVCGVKVRLVCGVKVRLVVWSEGVVSMRNSS